MIKKEYMKPFVYIKEADERADKKSKTLKAAENMLLREIAGECILVPVGEMALKVHGMISMSESGALLWKKLQKGCTEEELVHTILEEYLIDRETAVQDVRMFLQKMKGIDLIVETDG